MLWHATVEHEDSKGEIKDSRNPYVHNGFFSDEYDELWCFNRLKERGVEKGGGRHSALRGRERSVLNQTNTGSAPKATLGRLLRDEAGRVRATASLA